MSTKLKENRRKRIARIYILAKEKEIDNELLHTIVYERTQKESIKDLGGVELLEIIKDLKGKKKKKFSQDDYIQSLANKLKVENKESYLLGIVKKITNKDYVKLTIKDKSKIIEALKDIIKRQ